MNSEYNSSSEEESDDNENSDSSMDKWSAHDEGVDYGEADLLSECTAEWDCRS